MHERYVVVGLTETLVRDCMPGEFRDGERKVSVLAAEAAVCCSWEETVQEIIQGQQRGGE